MGIFKGKNSDKIILKARFFKNMNNKKASKIMNLETTISIINKELPSLTASGLEDNKKNKYIYFDKIITIKKVLNTFLKLNPKNSLPQKYKNDINGFAKNMVQGTIHCNAPITLGDLNVTKSKKIKFKVTKKTCPKGKLLNKKTNRCIKIKVKKEKFPKIELKSGELGKHGYKNIKSLSLKNRRKALNSAIKEYSAPKILKKIGLLKTYQKNKSPIVSSLLHDNMKYTRKKYDNQFKSSWKKSNLFK